MTFATRKRAPIDSESVEAIARTSVRPSTVIQIIRRGCQAGKSPVNKEGKAGQDDGAESPRSVFLHDKESGCGSTPQRCCEAISAQCFSAAKDRIPPNRSTASSTMIS